MGHLQEINPVMSKCHVWELEQVYRALFADALYAFPTLGAEFEKDLTRLLALVERRGIRVYLEDLPAVGKHLDRCLSLGQYNLSGLPLTKRFSGRVVIPKFLRGLYLLVFHECGRLREDYNSDAIFFLRQILFAAKKTTYECSYVKVLRSVEEFVVTDNELPEPEGYWNARTESELKEAHPYCGFHNSELLLERIRRTSDSQRIRELSIFLRVLDTVSGILTTTLGSYDPQEWRFRHGPGAVSRVVGPTNKYKWLGWSDTLESEYPCADYGYHSFSSWADSVCAGGIAGSEEPASRLIAVPKTFGGPRLIAAEPAEHQWCQQNIWHYLRSRASSSGVRLYVRFTDQSWNQRLCLRGSTDGTLATIDLSSASDRVACHVVGQFFRSNPKVLSCLRASRTRCVDQGLADHLPGTIQLRKFSTMGSACTFPVESLLFLGIAISSVLVKRGMEANARNVWSLEGEVAVFGDDIIIPVDSRELLCDALEVLYFKVNSHKSFWTGRFRESCGVDAFNGVNVTPVYWRRPYSGGPESLASTVECRNNFYNKFLLHTAAYLASTLPKGIPWVSMDSGVVGLKSRCKPRNDGLRTRYNRDLQRPETYVRSLIAKQDKLPTNDDSALLQFFTEQPDPNVVWKSGIAQRPRLQTKMRWVDTRDIIAQ